MRVVIADDDPIQRGILEQHLCSVGYEVEPFADSDAAWAALQEDPYRMVLADSQMPTVGGAKLIHRFRTASWPAYTYALFVTDSGADDDIVQGLGAGADDYLTKSVDPRQLRARIKIGERILDLEDRLQASAKRLRRLDDNDGLVELLNRHAHAHAHAPAPAELDLGARKASPSAWLWSMSTA